MGVLLLRRQNLLPVRRVVFSLLGQDLFSVLEVTEAANFGTTGFAAPTEAVPGPLSAMVLGQGLVRVAVSADFALQDSEETSFSVRPTRPNTRSICSPVTDDEAGNRSLMPSLDLSQYRLQILRRRLHAFAGILNFGRLYGHRVGKVCLAH